MNQKHMGLENKLESEQRSNRNHRMAPMLLQCTRGLLASQIAPSSPFSTLVYSITAVQSGPNICVIAVDKAGGAEVSIRRGRGAVTERAEKSVYSKRSQCSLFSWRCSFCPSDFLLIEISVLIFFFSDYKSSMLSNTKVSTP